MLRRCPQCARLYDAEASRPCPTCAAGRAPARLVRQPPLIIEGEVVRAGASLPPASRQPAARKAAEMWASSGGEAGREIGFHRPAAPSRARGLATGVALALIVGVTIPIAAAIPGIAALFARTDAVVVERVESATMVVGGESALVVTGTLTNPSSRELPVPAVRVALKGGEGEEAYSWTVEPEALTLAAGASVSFRSALRNPVSGSPRVVVSLVPREQRIGMR